jgi:hypothetical protein
VTRLHPCLLFAANLAQIRRERPDIVKCDRNRAEIFALPIKGAANELAVMVNDHQRATPTRNL